MKTKRIAANALLFHPAHGLCRVDRVVEQNHSGKKDLSYSLVPKITSRMKVRFIIAADDLEASGFHTIISAREADKILDYLKAGDSSSQQENQTWELARNVLTLSEDKLKARDQRKRQLLENSIRGLVGELACAFKLTFRETAARIEKSLGKKAKSDTLILAALGRAAED